MGRGIDWPDMKTTSVLMQCHEICASLITHLNFHKPASSNLECVFAWQSDGWDYTTSPPRWYGRWGSRESDIFGQYDTDAHEKDELCYDAPYYLPFLAAGNDRSEDAPAEGETFEYYRPRLGWIPKQYNSQNDPYDDGWDNGGFDTILPSSTAKNVITVGALKNAVINEQRNLNGTDIASFSAWGPTDDGRIKPDIVTTHKQKT